jgi:hypothetical protein
MGGFTSLDNLISNVSNSGKFWRADWNKNHATAGTVVAGTWQGLMGGAGNPPANTQLGGTTLIPQPCYDFGATAGGIQHGGPVSAAYDGYKTILTASGFSAAATSCPAILMLVDLLSVTPLANATISTVGTKTILGHEATTFSSSSGLLATYTSDIPTYTPISYTNSGGALPTGLTANTVYWTVRVSATTSRLATTLANAIAGTVIAFTDAGTGTHTAQIRTPRYSDGAGVQALMVASTAGTAGTGTFQLTYTNAAGTASKTTPSSPALPTNTAVSPLLTVPYSGTGAGKYGPFFPLAAADTGIRSIQNIILGSAGVTTGVYNLCLVKPLLTLPLSVIGVAAERDLVNQLPSMPRVYDGACLQWLLYSQVAVPNNTAYYGHLDFGWS